MVHDSLWLVCGCCGAGIRDTAEENTAHGQVPYPYDNGVGMCVHCGVDRRAHGASEKATRRPTRKLGSCRFTKSDTAGKVFGRW